MARIPYFDPAQARGRARDWYGKLPPLNIFRMMGHSGEMLDGFVRLGNQILAFSEIDPVLREIAIVRVGVLSNARYEVHQHEAISRRLDGVDGRHLGDQQQGEQPRGRSDHSVSLLVRLRSAPTARDGPTRTALWIPIEAGLAARH